MAIVFERVNRMGIELDVFQLLTAWTWSDEFDLQQRFEELAEEFSTFGFEAVGDDTALMLRCTAAVLQQDPSPTALVNMNGAEVRDAFEDVAQAIRRAIDFVRTNFHVHHVGLLPYSAILIPLSAFFSVRLADPITDVERATLVRWFWRASFAHRYSGNPQRNIRRDIEEAVKLREGGESTLDEIPREVSPGFFTDHRFNIRTVATKGLSCCWLMSIREHSCQASRSESTVSWLSPTGASTTTATPRHSSRGAGETPSTHSRTSR